MQDYMGEVAAAAPMHLRQFVSVPDMVNSSVETNYAVALIPAAGYSNEEWPAVWGFVNNLIPHPSILVYALWSDYGIWSSVLDAGCFDLILAPFTANKLRQAFLSAIEDFTERSEE
jgi:hypothetical protein